VRFVCNNQSECVRIKATYIFAGCCQLMQLTLLLNCGSEMGRLLDMAEHLIPHQVQPHVQVTRMLKESVRCANIMDINGATNSANVADTTQYATTIHDMPEHTLTYAFCANYKLPENQRTSTGNPTVGKPCCTEPEPRNHSKQSTVIAHCVRRHLSARAASVL
jgi:hypothetical protein